MLSDIRDQTVLSEMQIGHPANGLNMIFNGPSEDDQAVV